MRDQPDDGRVGSSGERREDRVALVQLRVLQPDLAQLVDEKTGELELLLGARPRRRTVRALRVDPDVAQEPLEYVIRELLGERARERRSRSQALRAA